MRRLDRVDLVDAGDHRPCSVEATAVAAVDHPTGGRAGLAAFAPMSAAVLAACTGSSGSQPSPITASAGSSQEEQHPPSTVVTESSDQDRVLERYGEFFVALPKASLMPEPRRNEVLAQYCGAGVQHRRQVSELTGRIRQSAYGQPTLTPRITDLGSNTAVIRDCQDTSKSGIQDVKTGDKETKGVPQTLVVTDLRRVDGLWKITKIDYRGPKC
jgi:hypothetical protein